MRANSVFERGGQFPGPTVWLYGDNDSFYAMSHSRANFSAFTSSGGHGSFIEVWPGDGVYGHAIVGCPVLWETRMDERLRSLGLPAGAR